MSAEKLKLEVILAAVDRITGPFKAMQKESQALAKGVKDAREQLKGLENQQKLVDAFRSTNKALGITSRDLEDARSRVKQIKAEMDATAAPTVKMQRAFAEASAKARELSANVNRLTESKQRLRQQLSSVGIDTTKLASEQRTLKGNIDQATAALSRQSAAAETHGKKMQRLHAAQAAYQKSMATRDKLASAGGKAIVAGTAINAAASIPVMAYAKAEDSATQLKVAMMGAGGKIHDQFKEINDLAEKLGNRLPGTTSDYQDMMTMLIRQGMPAKAILGGLGEATAYLAVQLKMAPTAAAEFVSKLQDATRTTDKDMMALMDTIQRTYYLGVDQGNMLQGFAKLSPALSVLRKEGLEAAQALAPLLVMADQAGMAGEAAGNAYRKIIQGSLDAKKLAKGNAELAGTGIKLDFSNGKGEFGGIDQMYAQLEKLKSVDTQRRLAALKKIFGDDAETLQALTIMIEKGADGYRDTQKKMANQAAIQERVNLQLKTLKNLWDAASGTFTNALVALGESVAPELHAFAEWMGKTAEAAQKWAKENPGLAAGLMHVVKWVAMGALAIGGLLVAAAGILGPLAALKFGLTAVGLASGTTAAGLGLLAGKALAVIAAFSAGYAVGTWINGQLNSVLSWLAGYDTTLGGLIFDLVEAVKDRFGELVAWFQALPTRFMAAGQAIVDGIIQGITSKWEALKATMEGLGDSAAGWLRDKLGIHSPSRVFAEIGGFTMEGLQGGILDAAKGPLGAVMGLGKQLATAGAGMVIGGAAMAGDLPAIDTRQALAPVAAMMQGAGGMGSVTINVYPSAGMDEAALARLVAAEFEKLQASQDARKRSSLRDSH
ncbi:MAG: phage tail tape measure protein [Rhodocyclaceae bacterium]|nr:phage tail tape measure protein [Rhodocyclaceae bacterium]